MGPVGVEASERAFTGVLTGLAPLRAFFRVVWCGSKIGESLSFTASEEQLVVRSINATRSVASEFCFSKSFFDEFVLADSRGGKVATSIAAAKFLLPAVKNPGLVKQLTFSLLVKDQVLLIELLLKSDILKRFHIPAEDSEILRAVYNTDRCTCNASVRPRFLSDILSNFHGKLEEIKLACSSSQFRVLSFVEDEDENAMNVLLRTEMAVDVKEFEEYFFPKADVVELTFSFKAFRAILELAEGFDVPLRIFFDKGGLPIVFIISYPGRMNQSFEAQFILATRQHITDSVASSRTDLQSTADSGRKPSSLAEKVSASTGPESSTRLGNTSIASFLTRGDNDEGSWNRAASPKEAPTDAERSGIDEGRADRGDDEDDDEFVEGTPPPE